MPELEAPAPAQGNTAAPTETTVSAERAAANAGDFTAFQEAADARRQGTPLPKVTQAADETETPQPGTPRTISKRQQAINDYERRIAEQDQRIKALEARTTAPAARVEPAPAAPQPKTETPQAAYKRYLAMPDVPKIEDFESVGEHTAAMSTFIAEKRDEERDVAARAQHARDEASSEEMGRYEQFGARLQKAKEADPDFVKRLTPDVLSLKGLSAGRAAGEEPSPRHIIGEQLYDSPVADRVLLHFSEHPEALRALEAMPADLQRIPDPLKRMRAHMNHIVREFTKLEGRLEDQPTAAEPEKAQRPPTSTITAAPPPPPQLGRAGRSSDPSASAVARGDWSAFHEAEEAKRQRRRSSA